jgi:multimeric flavodoxin WrbA
VVSHPFLKTWESQIVNSPSETAQAERYTGPDAVTVTLDYGYAGQTTIDEITGGSPYGATTIAGGDGSRLPTANELQGGRYQGRKITETANKLQG